MAVALCGAVVRRQELPKMGQLASYCYEHYFRPERMLDEYMSLYKRRISHNQALRST